MEALWQAPSIVSLLSWSQSPSRASELRDETGSLEKRVERCLRGWPWSAMPRSSAVPFLATSPRGTQRNGTLGSSSPKRPSHPSSLCWPRYWRWQRRERPRGHGRGRRRLGAGTSRSGRRRWRPRGRLRRAWLGRRT
eukprot:scaffold124172_cov73-Phaeocystis_antarctica.AAC.1